MNNHGHHGHHHYHRNNGPLRYLVLILAVFSIRVVFYLGSFLQEGVSHDAMDRQERLASSMQPREQYDPHHSYDHIQTLPTMNGIRFMTTTERSSLSSSSSLRVNDINMTTPTTTTITFTSSQHDNFQPLSCTLKQEEKIYQEIGNVKARRKATNCPNPTWLHSYYENISMINNDNDIKNNNNNTVKTTTPPPPFVALNVGCNKGNDAIRLARMGTRNPIFNESSWSFAFYGDLLPSDYLIPACRIDRNRSDLPLQSRNNNNNKEYRPGHVHCIEPLPKTYHRLSNVSMTLNLIQHGLVVTHAAVSDQTGRILFPNAPDVTMGFEGGSIDTCLTNNNNNNNNNNNMNTDCTSVPMYGLDDYVTKFLPQHFASDLPIHVLMIDVEGFDYDVLVGGRETLKRVQYLEFEYHNVGSWKKHTVLDAVYGPLKDFNCYWAGQSKLWRITGCANWTTLAEQYKERIWSNVACVHHSQNELSRVMEDIFLDTIL